MSTRSESGWQRDRKRASKACKRCRDQKIKCSGSDPCDPCRRRGLPCQFEGESEKILISRRYLSGLQAKLASYEKQLSQSASPDDNTIQVERLETSIGESTKDVITSGITAESSKAVDISEAPLTNPLALRTANWAPARHGNMLFMGTSSNWAFGRRVLTMAHETLTGEPLPIDNLLFDGHVYDLGWDGLKENCSQDEFDFSTLPAREFALYLINSVQFRCGTLFQLYDEDTFMRQFEQFHGNSDENEPISPLWYVHYLILLAFGKAFVVQISKSASPPGSELFVQAMKMMPDLVLLDCCPIEKIQVICSIALYLQCIFCRPAAHNVISQAISMALQTGIHTEMKSQHLDEKYVQRCRLVWSTLYILERNMASLLGVPLLIAEEYISTPYPVCARNKQRTNTLEIQIKISKILSKIHLSVYGTEGQLDSRYLDATRSVLRSFSEIADQLNNSFAIGTNDNASGISRISAHLHLQYHQCIVLTTRPLLYTFLQSRLGQADASLLDRLKSESVRRLVQICLESSYRIIKILSVLLGQGLLENFLPFDLDAAFSSTIAIIMAATIDASLVADYSHWIQRAYAVLDEISSRGNTVALLIGSELRQLEDTLEHLRMKEGWITMSLAVSGHPLDATQDGADISMPPPEVPLGTGFLGESPMNFGLSPGQLLELANSLDIDSFLVSMGSPEDARL
ncbi:Fungal-trans domain-containing protein [Fusarium sp. LHS14.1]|nr:Fungal-trans domain-containing protein [Fusarium sp. LHS14.1]